MINQFYNINFSLDIALHVLILFTFLTIFFFTYISKLEKQNLDNTTNNAIINNMDSLLDSVDKFQEKLKEMNKIINIDWKAADNIADTLIQNSQGESQKIKENNDKLFKGSIIAISVAFAFFTGLVIFLKYYMGYDIHVKHILLMNFIIFSITGAIEFWFFQNVASKYIPVGPDFVSNTILERVKYNI
jgi:hypothetical protein